jgi:hypothetical protein
MSKGNQKKNDYVYIQIEELSFQVRELQEENSKLRANQADNLSNVLEKICKFKRSLLVRISLKSKSKYFQQMS